MAVDNPDDLHGKNTETKVKWGCALVAEKQKTKVYNELASYLYICHVSNMLLKCHLIILEIEYTIAWSIFTNS